MDLSYWSRILSYACITVVFCSKFISMGMNESRRLEGVVTNENVRTLQCW